jgi:hypothetical protein
MVSGDRKGLSLDIFWIDTHADIFLYCSVGIGHGVISHFTTMDFPMVPDRI